MMLKHMKVNSYQPNTNDNLYFRYDFDIDLPHMHNKTIDLTKCCNNRLDMLHCYGLSQHEHKGLK
jgi:hypothetical protein